MRAARRSVEQEVDELVAITEAAFAIASSIVLGNIRLLQLPFGGSIAFASVPIIVFALIRGPKAGALAGACAGVGHGLFGGVIIHPIQLVLDYFLAYAALGVAGFMRNAGTFSIRFGALLAGLAQLACFTVSGIVFFSAFTPDGWPVAWYAFAYNAAHVLPETFIAMLIAPALVAAHKRAMA